jgi:hypothetical protein
MEISRPNQILIKWTLPNFWIKWIEFPYKDRILDLKISLCKNQVTQTKTTQIQEITNFITKIDHLPIKVVIIMITTILIMIYHLSIKVHKIKDQNTRIQITLLLNTKAHNTRAQTMVTTKNKLLWILISFQNLSKTKI